MQLPAVQPDPSHLFQKPTQVQPTIPFQQVLTQHAVQAMEEAEKQRFNARKLEKAKEAAQVKKGESVYETVRKMKKSLAALVKMEQMGLIGSVARKKI